MSVIKYRRVNKLTRAERRRLLRRKAKELFKTKYNAETGLTRQQRRLTAWEIAKVEIE